MGNSVFTCPRGWKFFQEVCVRSGRSGTRSECRQNAALLGSKFPPSCIEYPRGSGVTSPFSQATSKGGIASAISMPHLKERRRQGRYEKLKRASDWCSPLALPLFRDGQAKCDGYVPRLGKGPLWTTGPPGSSKHDTALLSEEGGRWGSRVGSIGVTTLLSCLGKFVNAAGNHQNCWTRGIESID